MGMLSKIHKGLIEVARGVIPSKVFNRLKAKKHRKQHERYLKKLTKQVITYHKNSTDNEVIEVLDFLKENPITVFPYNYVKTYKKEDIEVIQDHTLGLKYVRHQGKKLYFKRSMSVNAIKSLYVGLLIDQDPKSPHLYLTDTFNLSNTDVIADIGAAEGNFTLSNIDTVKKAYLFESNPEWIEALQATFKPWETKVEIVNAFVTDYDSHTTISMGTFYKTHSDISFFKVDIEGEEQRFLNACVPIFKENVDIKIAICTYHKHQDELDFTNQLKVLGFNVQPSQKYMLYYYDKTIMPPYLRRGLLRASKTDSHGR